MANQSSDDQERPETPLIREISKICERLMYDTERDRTRVGVLLGLGAASYVLTVVLSNHWLGEGMATGLSLLCMIAVVLVSTRRSVGNFAQLVVDTLRSRGWKDVSTQSILWSAVLLLGFIASHCAVSTARQLSGYAPLISIDPWGKYGGEPGARSGPNTNPVTPSSMTATDDLRNAHAQGANQGTTEDPGEPGGSIGETGPGTTPADSDEGLSTTIKDADLIIPDAGSVDAHSNPPEIEEHSTPCTACDTALDKCGEELTNCQAKLAKDNAETQNCDELTTRIAQLEGRKTQLVCPAPPKPPPPEPGCTELEAQKRALEKKEIDLKCLATPKPPGVGGGFIGDSSGNGGTVPRPPSIPLCKASARRVLCAAKCRKDDSADHDYATVDLICKPSAEWCLEEGASGVKIFVSKDSEQEPSSAIEELRQGPFEGTVSLSETLTIARWLRVRKKVQPLKFMIKVTAPGEYPQDVSLGELVNGAECR